MIIINVESWDLDIYIYIYMAGSRMCEDEGWVGRYVQNCSSWLFRDVIVGSRALMDRNYNCREKTKRERERRRRGNEECNSV